MIPDHDDHPMCTCCQVPRPIMPWADDPNQWVHIDTQDEADTRHVHTDWHATDCDGGMSGSSTERIWSIRWEHANPRVLAEGPTWDDFWRFTAHHAIPPHADHATIEISGGDRIRVNETHDEGGKSLEIRVCSDPWCAFEKAERRDLQAEAAGY